ncbi:MAG: UDP-N-acetylmuramoyl-tripeptide--D-alanyl-D-alanine ligase [Bacteroidaceae bacterium]|nr:UDP-N-acetylmuramoyl-tripeptide--D-alanyl-D-alanine ligase [Bacteroidaceae bacterium]
MDIASLYRIYQEHPVVTTDSRKCPSGSMFFALRGETFNGNQYARQALEQGCAVAVVDDGSVVPPGDARFVLVDDVLSTLQQLAAWHRRQWGGPVVQVTGTNGKTTTKELLAAVLGRKYNVHYTQGNLNNHIGVPLTLLGMRAEHNLAVVETGANHPGEIAQLCGYAQADCGLITNVGRAHLEGFGSFEGVKRTKGELYDDLKARGKFIFLNAQDDDLRQMAAERGFCTSDAPHCKPYAEGRVSACAPFVEFQWREGEAQPWHTVSTHLVGAYNLANLRAAVTVGLHFGVPASDIEDALAAYVPTNSRSEWRNTDRNRLLVDAYNANPASMAAALDNFDLIEGENKMVILGDMRELGADSHKEHQRIVARLEQMQLQEVWLVGSEFAATRHPFRSFANVEEVKQELAQRPLFGRTILIKGSNGIRLQQLPEHL